MKFSAALSLALASTAVAKSARNRYPVKRAPVGSGAIGAAGIHGAAPIVGGIPVAVGHANGAVEVTQTLVINWVFAGGPSAVTQTINPYADIARTVIAPMGGAPMAVPVAGGATTTIQPGQTAIIPGGAAATHSVKVGGPAGLTFSPQEVQAAVGDIIEFEFFAQNHTVTQSTFDAPCDVLAGGMDTGYMPNPDNSLSPAPRLAMQVMTTDALWMFCAQGNHCGQGMVFSINPTAAKTHAQYQANAISQRGNGAATSITGGAPAAPAEPAPVGSDVGAAPSVDPNLTVDPNLAIDPNQSVTLDPNPIPSSNDVVPTVGAIGGDINNNIGTAPLNGGIVMGVGTMQPDGSCQCAVQCAAGQAFPSPNQGVNAFGGVAGTIPMANGVAPDAAAPSVGLPARK